MITPFDDITGKSRDEIVAGYLALGFDQDTAEAYTAVLLGDTQPMPVVKSVTMSVKNALDLGAGHEQFTKAVGALADAGVDFVKVSYNDTTDDVSVDKPDSVWVAIMLPADVAKSIDVPGGVADHHITLAYLGYETDMSLNQKQTLVSVVNKVAADHVALHGVIGDNGYFEQSGSYYAKPNIPGLVELRKALTDALDEAGLWYSDEHDFTPHVTLAYTDDPNSQPTTDPTPVAVTKLTAIVGGYQADADLRADMQGAVQKSVDEKRFTLAPVYIPGQYDAHGDWSTDDDIQKAVWDFNRGDRLLALQHHPEFGPVGEAVELMIVPWEMDVPMQKADGTRELVHFPANTPWMGAVWTPEVWPLVKSGAVNGYSIGGTASMLDVAIPGAEDVLKAKVGDEA